MTPDEPFVDIHCHLLPGVDDGAPTLDDALAMAEMAVADGIGTIVATPHQLGNYTKNSGSMVRAAVERFQQTLSERRIPLRVLAGGDVRLEPDLVRKIRSGDVLSLADRRRHVLLELPHEIYVPLERPLAELAAAGIVGVLSHPERNRGLLGQPDLVCPLVRRGCLMQVTAGSLTGIFGPQVQRFSEYLLKQGLVHFVATDAHGTGKRRPVLRGAFDRVTELVGREAALALFCRNPAALVAGGAVASEVPKSARFARSGWLRRTFSSEHACRHPIYGSTPFR